MPDVKLLWEIQILDEKRKELESKLKEGELLGELKSLKNLIEASKSQFKNLKEEYLKLKKELHLKEHDSESIGEQIKIIEQKLYGGVVTSPKEIEKNSMKLEELKVRLKQEDDVALALMEKQESMRLQLEALGAGLAEKTESFRRLHGSYLAVQQSYRSSLAQIPLMRQKLLDMVEAELWQKYLEMKKKFPDPLAKVEKGTCQRCRVGVSFHDLRYLKEGKDLVHCSHCGRMLYWEK
ncbi:MAG: hypothetical protein C4589_06380 [Peptococcaceae bacterium]|nr:MAG: hypothetical protein C4589_06380 [Peptococcaceae bacterium]